MILSAMGIGLGSPHTVCLDAGMAGSKATSFALFPENERMTDFDTWCANWRILVTLVTVGGARG
jgi:hypothetical protein